MLIIYATNITKRLQYVAETLFSLLDDPAVQFTTNVEEFKAAADYKINYSAARLTTDELHIQPSSILFEQGVKSQLIECFKWKDVPVFFKTAGDIPFDIFAASFYLISRYEEYLPHSLDEYGRYAHTNSLAYRQQFLHLPLLNIWMKELINISAFKLPFKAFRFTPTYDIDIAFSYANQPVKKNLGALIKSVTNRQWLAARQIVNVLRRKQNDPFDTYDFLHQLHTTYHLKPIYFFLLAEQKRGYDKNISPHTKAMQQLVKQHVEKYKIGIHPSWQSSDNVTVLKQEIKLLENIVEDKVLHSRQHYIRFNLPGTFETLSEQGIQFDYSMGYGSINGFRASIASPFYWYNLAKEEKTNLLLYPCAFMDANSFFEQHYTAMQAAAELQQYYAIVKKVEGELITIFHNHFITEQPAWMEWRKMYASFIEKNFS